MQLTNRFKWLGITRIVSTCISALSLLILPNLLGAGTYSRYAYYLAIIGVAFQFSGLGVEQVIQRFIIKYRVQSEKGLIKSLLGISAIVEIFSLSLIFGVLLLTFFFNPEITEGSIWYLLLVFLIVSARALSQYAYQVELGFERYKLAVLLSAPTEALLLGFVILFFIFGNFPGIILGIFLAYAISTTISISIMLLTLHTQGIFKALKKEIPSKKELAKFGIPLYISGNLSKLSGSVGIILLALFFGKKNPDVGQFSIAISIVTVLSYFINTLNLTSYPEIAKAHDQGKPERYQVIMNSLVRISLLFVIPTYFSMLYFSELFFNTLLKEFTSTLLLLPLVGIILFIFAIEKPYQQVALTHHMTRITLEKTFIYFLLYCLIYPPLIYLYASIGAAISFILVQLLAALYGSIRIWRKSRVSIPFLATFKILLSGVILGIPLLFPSPYREVIGVIALGIWAIFILKGNFLTITERKLLKEFLKNLHPKNILKIS